MLTLKELITLIQMELQKGLEEIEKVRTVSKARVFLVVDKISSTYWRFYQGKEGIEPVIAERLRKEVISTISDLARAT